MPEKQLTVDTGVLMSASGSGAPDHHDVSVELLERMLAVDECLAVVDTEGMITFQYETKMDAGQFGRQWFRRMSELGKVCEVKRLRLDRGVSVALRECHLDPEDMKYFVRTAASSASGLLVSHDPDYSAAVRRVLMRGLNVRVLNQIEATIYVAA